ncbi:MAG: hypothetical protein V3U89_01065 [Methylophilaceae bacterium]
MKVKYILVLAIFFILTGCASLGEHQQGQVERITPEELAKLLSPPVATVTLDEIVTDSKQGKTSDVIIAKIKDSNSRYELSSTQILDLNKQGVDVKVLDYIQQSNELAKQNAIATEMNRREKEKSEVQKQLNQARLARHRYYDPFWGSRYNFYYRHGFPGRYWRGSRFGWGMSYGHPFGW